MPSKGVAAPSEEEDGEAGAEEKESAASPDGGGIEGGAAVSFIGGMAGNESEFPSYRSAGSLKLS
ncbi:MAG: hypothetical protein WA740_04610 [Candidatus Binataceae bacterium]